MSKGWSSISKGFPQFRYRPISNCYATQNVDIRLIILQRRSFQITIAPYQYRMSCSNLWRCNRQRSPLFPEMNRTAPGLLRLTNRVGIYVATCFTTGIVPKLILRCTMNQRSFTSGASPLKKEKDIANILWWLFNLYYH